MQRVGQAAPDPSPIKRIFSQPSVAEGSRAGSRPAVRSANTSAIGLSRPGQRRHTSEANVDGRRYCSGSSGANAHTHHTTEPPASTRSHTASARIPDRSGTAKGTSQSPYRLGPGVPPLFTFVVCVKLMRKKSAMSATAPSPASNGFRPGRVNASTIAMASASSSTGSLMKMPRLGSKAAVVSSRNDGQCRSMASDRPVQVPSRHWKYNGWSAAPAIAAAAAVHTRQSRRRSYTAYPMATRRAPPIAGFCADAPPRARIDHHGAERRSTSALASITLVNTSV